MTPLATEPDICANRHGGNEQSREAHVHIQPRAVSIRDKVLALIAANPGVTCEQIEGRLGLKHQTASARISELKRDGKIVVAPYSGRTASGCTAARYRVNDGEEIGRRPIKAFCK